MQDKINLCAARKDGFNDRQGIRIKNGDNKETRLDCNLNFQLALEHKGRLPKPLWYRDCEGSVVTTYTDKTQAK